MGLGGYPVGFGGYPDGLGGYPAGAEPGYPPACCGGYPPCWAGYEGYPELPDKCLILMLNKCF